jgi:nucleotide-binding universal stress UspA family protein
MAGPTAPVLIGYDGSEVARAAVRHAAELFAGRPAVLATVWEPGLAAIPVGLPGTIGAGGLPLDMETVEAVDRGQREHASTVAGDGAEFARSLGLVAEPQAVPDEVDVAETLLGIARERGAAVVVVGSPVAQIRRSLEARKEFVVAREQACLHEGQFWQGASS